MEEQKCPQCGKNNIKPQTVESAYNECPMCRNENIKSDPENNVYSCPFCQFVWKSNTGKADHTNTLTEEEALEAFLTNGKTPAWMVRICKRIYSEGYAITKKG